MERGPLPELLRQLRQVRGWSQARMAQALCDISGRDTVTRQEVYRWECGRRVPRFWLPYLAKVLEIPLEQLECARPARRLEQLLPEAAPVLGGHSTPGGRQVAQYLAARVHALRLADDVIAGKDLLEPAFRELNAAIELYRGIGHRNRVEREVLVAVGELAQIAGWISSDAGRHQHAEATYRLGLDAAREAGDNVLAAQLSGCLAYQWANTGREHDAVALAAAAVSEAGAGAAPRARALFWDRLAWCRTKAGDAEGAVAALGEAGNALSRHGDEQEPEPAWVYWVSPDELKVMEARVFTELRRPLRAVPLLTSALARYDVTHGRELGLYLSWLAVAYSDANEPEQAAIVAKRMWAVSARTGSSRVTERGRVVLRRLAPFRGLDAVDEAFELAEAMTAGVRR